ncbi:MAG TPA: tripartite tricarboxylate transporter TctB family protein [Usitatibacter sp.]|nr:tripartite tricarboxylate transporter TctB family protein [Usitatibacter sp.]
MTGEAEIVVGEPEAPADDSPAVLRTRTAETITLAVILAFSLLMAWDNWRTGNRWESTGPQAGYFPFYVSLIMAGACLWGLGGEWMRRRTQSGPFVRRNQLKRVAQVFIPALLFIPLTQWVGIYVASFVLVAGFMRWVGGLRLWISAVTGLVFAATMFMVFEVAFNVIMPKGPLERFFGF